MEFIPFRKIGRLSREITVTEKIDGTNGVIFIGELDQPKFLVGSRSRWIPQDTDNHGFARWAYEHKDELIAGLGPGWHHGEWWGNGIARGYGINEKRFSLFNTSMWAVNEIALTEASQWPPNGRLPPACCHVVPHTLSRRIRHGRDPRNDGRTQDDGLAGGTRLYAARGSRGVPRARQRPVQEDLRERRLRQGLRRVSQVGCQRRIRHASKLASRDLVSHLGRSTRVRWERSE